MIAATTRPVRDGRGAGEEPAERPCPARRRRRSGGRVRWDRSRADRSRVGRAGWSCRGSDRCGRTGGSGWEGDLDDATGGRIAEGDPSAVCGRRWPCRWRARGRRCRCGRCATGRHGGTARMPGRGTRRGKPGPSSLHAEQHLRRPSAWATVVTTRRHRPTLAGVADGVVDEVAHHPRQLERAAGHDRRTVGIDAQPDLLRRARADRAPPGTRRPVRRARPVRPTTMHARSRAGRTRRAGRASRPSSAPVRAGDRSMRPDRRPRRPRGSRARHAWLPAAYAGRGRGW